MPRTLSVWQAQFTDATTSTAFSLSLTRNQVSLLDHIGAHDFPNQWRSAKGRDLFVPTVRGLIDRGLVEHNPMAMAKSTLPPGTRIKWFYRLTPAGVHVLALLRLAGLADEVPRHETKLAEAS